VCPFVKEEDKGVHILSSALDLAHSSTNEECRITAIEVKEIINPLFLASYKTLLCFAASIL
jgi:hypothetical protein